MSAAPRIGVLGAGGRMVASLFKRYTKQAINWVRQWNALKAHWLVQMQVSLQVLAALA